MDNDTDILNGTSEFMGRTSKHFLTYGNALSLFTVATLVIFGFFVSFNQTIEAEALITSNPPPVTLLSRINGKIQEIKISSGDTVKEGEVLAVLESSGEFMDILYLDSLLAIDQTIAIAINKLLEFYPVNLRLGPSIQESYTTYMESYLSYILLQSLEIENGNIYSMKERKTLTEKQISSKYQQLETSRDKLKSGKMNLNRYLQLYKKGVFSENEMEIEKRNYLDLLNQKLKTQEELEALSISLSDISNQTKSSQSYLTSKYVMSSSKLQLDRQTLISKIEFWKQQYLFTSPISGIISTYDSWHKNQEVKKGENIFTIVSNTSDNIFAKCKVPIQNTGSLIKGQKVLLHIDNYPYPEWGALVGTVKTISSVPKLGPVPYYLVDVELKNLTTNFDKELQFKHNMNGKAFILLNELSLFQRVIFNLRKTFRQ
ncbi:HlyD family secretion protein [Maribacter sp. ACAM166]|uniref:HlyD family secretion protein n=1 Tax=Maribacter sp. ACAM166 TaxID=2508996 RepID=UPI0010FDC288|nr:HlyD family efflux transporter periplasmic adaptor subunit [Maribacter sp. ACAM166]TLP82357.1 HlyD family efflux transporter periplasmic adaptor subunit [Maribacter sp. ACAM166]